MNRPFKIKSLELLRVVIDIAEYKNVYLTSRYTTKHGFLIHLRISGEGGSGALGDTQAEAERCATIELKKRLKCIRRAAKYKEELSDYLTECEYRFDKKFEKNNPL